jgi:hypothetical protein
MHNTHAFFPKGIADLRYSSETPTFCKNYLAMSNADVSSGKPIAVWSQSVSGVNAINPLVAFYDIHYAIAIMLQKLKNWFYKSVIVQNRWQ